MNMRLLFLCTPLSSSSISFFGFIGYCDGGSRAFPAPVCIGDRKKAVHARYPADAIIGPCHGPVCGATQVTQAAIGQLNQYKNPVSSGLGLVSDSNSSPSDVCMPQNAHHRPYYLVWGPGPNIGRDILVAEPCDVVPGKRIGSRIF